MNYLKIKKTAKKWFSHRREKIERVLCWKFDEKEAKIKKITEQEYIDKYVHPNDR